MSVRHLVSLSKTDAPTRSLHIRMGLASRNSLGNVLGLSAGAGVRAKLSLVVEVDHSASSAVLQSFLGAAHDVLLGALGLLNLRCLVSDLTITGHRSVLLSHCSKLLVFNNNTDTSINRF